MNHGQSTYTVTVTNNSNGVSVDYETETPMTLLVPEVAAEVIKDLVNTVRSYPVRRKNPVLQGGDIRRGFPPDQVFAVVQCIGG